MSITYLIIGGNIGDRVANLQETRQQLSEKVGNILVGSSIYQTAAWGAEQQTPYLNQVLCIETTLQPFELLAATQEIEQKLGRIRTQRWAARTMDIDILFYDQQIINTQELTVPHGRILERKFVLVPLCEIAAEMLHPVWQLPMKKLLEYCEDNLLVEIFGKYFATDNKI
jgi:2-amino-4-hydroxy-6-hydroxymethyldihydropteridine diphosphokinase